MLRLPGGRAGLAIIAGAPASGGTIKPGSTRLIGHYADKVWGAGWAAHADTEVTIHECSTPYYTESSCDRGDALTVQLETGKKADEFKGALSTSWSAR